MKRYLVLVLLTAACGSSEPETPPAGSPEPVGQTLTAEISIGVFSNYEASYRKDDTCDSFDFGADDQLLVKDAANTTIGVGDFRALGEWVTEPGEDFPKIDGTCVWTTTVEGIPEADFYMVELVGYEPVTVPRRSSNRRTGSSSGVSADSGMA